MPGVDDLVRSAVAEVLAEGGRALPPPGSPLQLDSLGVVALVDLLETRLPLRLRPEDVTAQSFRTLETLLQTVRTRLGP
ncbi:MAG: acyl carrier protein [Deltaproteobacteria bacterium]|nr:acyl carrier protein [Deltaproteobacteria bacterium]